MASSSLFQAFPKSPLFALNHQRQGFAVCFFSSLVTGFVKIPVIVQSCSSAIRRSFLCRSSLG
jgi:hypothetical protein